MRKKKNLAFRDDSSAFFENSRGEKDFFSDHGIVLVVGVVGVTELSIGTELELEKLVAEFSLVTDIVSEVELSLFFSCCHCCGTSSSSSSSLSAPARFSSFVFARGNQARPKENPIIVNRSYLYSALFIRPLN